MLHRRRIVFLTCLLLVPGCARPQRPTAPLAAEHVTLASFNIRMYSTDSRDDAELAQIADILQRYDLVAVQEVRDEQVLARTVAILRQRGLEYTYDISPPVGHTAKERYAFLYRPDRIRQVVPGALYAEQVDEFIREPFYATFAAGHFDFTLVTIHVLFGSGLPERRPELRALANVVATVQNVDPREQDVILLGDFNAPPTDDGFALLAALPTMAFLIGPPEKTTITDTSLYDNIWLQAQHVREYAAEDGVDRFDETMFGNDDAAAELAVSDHRPIWAKFVTTGPDDD